MEQESKASKSRPLQVAVMILLLVIVGVGSYYAGSRGLLGKPFGMGQRGGGRPGMSMESSTPPELSAQQKAQLDLGISTQSKDKTFNLTGANFYFVPNKITVNQGDTVTFVMTNAGGMHDLIIDDLGIKTPVIKSGEVATATFTADKTGTFEYYCDLPGHKEKGMVGTLTVL